MDINKYYEQHEIKLQEIHDWLLYHHHVAVLTLNKQEHQKIVDSLFYNIDITRQQEQKQEQEINPLQKLTKEHLRRGPKDKEYKISTVIKYNEISKFFNMTLTNAAEKLNMSKSLLKRLCRENGITKWPFRKRRKKL